jgi:hypothetical protein
MNAIKIAALPLLALATLLAGCATSNGPPAGLLFSNVKGPLAVTGAAGDPNNHGFNCSGESKAYTIFGLVTFGDAGIDAAKKSGSHAPFSVVVSHVDYQWVSALGIGQYTTRVYFYDPNRVTPCGS